MSDAASSSISGSASSSSEPINARTTRINHLILGHPEATSKVARAVTEALSREGLLDALCLLFDECNKEYLKKKDRNIFDFVSKYRDVIKEANSLRVNVKDFCVKSLIGKGYFGEVHLAAEKSTKDLYAIKKIRKSQTMTCAQVKEERDIMAYKTSEWITSLQYAFQDHEHLYLVMEYLPGGDLLSLMIRHGAFDEELARFYLAEMTQALHALHKMGFVHRDIKPENILLDRFGHLKLADFGNAAALSRSGTAVTLTPVGTPDYIAPELLDTLSTTVSHARSVHDATCDFWSMGVIGYEFLTEVTPFHADSVHDTYAQIREHVESAAAAALTYPTGVEVSRAFRSLIDGLVTRKSKRLTYQQLLQHAYFADVDWANLRHQVPPIIPSLNGEDDTSNFEDVDKTGRRSTFTKTSNASSMASATLAGGRSRGNDFSGQNLPFIGYSFVHEECEDSALGSSVGGGSGVGGGSTSVAAGKELELLRQRNDLQKKVNAQATDIKTLQADLLEAQRKSAKTDLLEKILMEAKNELTARKDELKAKTIELAACNTDIKTLRSSLKIVEEGREKRDANIAEVVSSTYQKWQHVKRATDSNYENQIWKKNSEIGGLNEKLVGCEQALVAKGEECAHLQERVHKYKELLKASKDQQTTDKTDFDLSKRQLTDAYEQKIREFKAKLQQEKEAKQAVLGEMAAMRRDLTESVSSTQSVEQSRKTAEKNTEAIKTRLNDQIRENHALRDEKATISRKVADLQQRLDASMADLARLRQEHDVQTQELSRRQSATSRRSSNGGTELFRSAQGSLESISSGVEEQLRTDLNTAKENEIEQRKRADRLAEAVARLEEAINNLKPNAEESLLERLNIRLEDQLASVREQANVERHQSRTAILSLYKLEKKLDEMDEEKKRTARRIELAEERYTKLRTDRDELDRQLRDNALIIRTKQERIDELLAQIVDYKADVKKEHAMWEKSEHERMRDKSEIIEHVSKVHQLEERCVELRRKLAQAESRYDAVQLEQKRLQKEHAAVQKSLRDAEDQNGQHEAEARNMQLNTEALKHTITIMDQQINKLEAMYEAEATQNRAHCQKADKLWSTVRSRTDEIAALRQELDGEKAQKVQHEARCIELKCALDDAQEKSAAHQLQSIETQEQLVAQTGAVYASQESVEILSAELANLQRINENCSRELNLIKEENTRILTDLFHAKDENNRVATALKESDADGTALRTELEQLRGTLSEQKNYYLHREIKSEATQAQLTKLVNYLQQRVNELSQKKKKTLAGVLFGTNSSSSRKENVVPLATALGEDSSMSAATLKRVQEDLRRERQRSAQLKEQLLQAKTDIQATTAAVSAMVVAPSAPHADEFYQRQSQSTETNPVAPATPDRMKSPSAHNRSTQQDHRFEVTLDPTPVDATNVPFTPCIVCQKQIAVDRSYMRCKECKATVHRRCRAEVRITCEAEELRRMQHVKVERGTTRQGLDDITSSAEASEADEAASGTSDSASEVVVGVPQREYFGDVVLRSAEVSPPVSVNCVYEVSDGVLLLGTESGLYSYHTNNRQLVHIPPLVGVTHLTVCPLLAKCLLICDGGRQLCVTELRHLQSRAQAATCLRPKLDVQTIDVPFVNRQTTTERWHHVSIYTPPSTNTTGSTSSSSSSAPLDAHVIACNSSRLVILRFDSSLGRFKAVCALDTARPVSGVLFTRHSAIVASDKFFEIDLKSFQGEEFLDESDGTCIEARTVCRPHSVFQVNSQELLLCFAEFGVFVDTFGNRSRPENVSWASEPTAFVFRDPLLFVSYRNMVEVVRINKSYRNYVEQRSADGGAKATTVRSYITLAEPQLVGDSGAHGAYVLAQVTGTTGGSRGGELLLVNGIRSLKTTASNSTETLLSSVADGCGGSVDTLSTIQNDADDGDSA